MVFLALASEPLWSPACPEGVGELFDGEDAFTVELSSLLFRHVRQQAEVVLLDRLLPTSVPKLALDAVAIQNEVRRRMAGKQFGDLPDYFPHLPRRMVVAVDDIAAAHVAAQHFRKHERIERQQQLVVPV